MATEEKKSYMSFSVLFPSLFQSASLLIFLFFFGLSTLAKTFSVVLNKSSENRHPCCEGFGGGVQREKERHTYMYEHKVIIF